MAIDVDLQEARLRLDERRTELQQLRRSLEEESASSDVYGGELSTVDQHPADVGTVAFERSKDVSILASLERRLSDVEDALGRIETGQYGVCQACGTPIGAERLMARPDVRFCLDDQERAERDV